MSIRKLFSTTRINTTAILSREMKRVESTLEKVEEIHKRDWRKVEHFSEKISKFAGSWQFIYGLVFILICWIALNTYYFVAKPLDPLPFALTNFTLSIIAVIQAPIIMMGQSRAAKMDKVRAELDLEKDLRDLQIDQKALEILVELQKDVKAIKKKVK